MQDGLPRRTLAAMLCVAAAAASFGVAGETPSSPAADAIVPMAGMPPVPDPRDVYCEALPASSARRSLARRRASMSPTPSRAMSLSSIQRR